MKVTTNKNLDQVKAYAPPLECRRSFEGKLLDFNEKDDGLDRSIYPEYDALRKKISEYCSVELTSIALGAGSGSLIDVIFRAYCGEGDKVFIPKPSFFLLFNSARIAGATIDSPRYASASGDYPYGELALSDRNYKIITICNPNNPTGSLCTLPEIESIAKANPNSLILVDEAYYEFSRVTAVGLVKDYENIVVTRTFSKAFGLASMRVGYAVADKSIIENILKLANPYNVAMQSATSAASLLAEVADTTKYVDEVMEESRAAITDYFVSRGIAFYETSANFVYFKPEDPIMVYEALKTNGILVRKVDDDTALRVTIGKTESVQEFTKAMDSILDLRNRKKVALIDRDGTLIYEPTDTYQVDKPEDLRILPGVIESLKKMMYSGYELQLVTNQDGLGTDQYPYERYVKVQAVLTMTLAREGVFFSKVWVCPHFFSDRCPCRKPKAELVRREFQKREYVRLLVVGDRNSDEEFAKNLNAKFIRAQTNGDLSKVIKE